MTLHSPWRSNISPGILEQSMGARNQVGIELSHRLVRLLIGCGWQELIPWNQFLGLKSLKILSLFNLLCDWKWEKYDIAPCEILPSLWLRPQRMSLTRNKGGERGWGELTGHSGRRERGHNTCRCVQCLAALCLDKNSLGGEGGGVVIRKIDVRGGQTQIADSGPWTK